MAKHIGIVACSYEGAALCYRTICNEGSAIMGNHCHPEISMHTHPLSNYMDCVEVGDWKGVADLMISSSEKLSSAGADFLICPDNTIHQAFSFVIEKSPLPWLHIAKEVAKEAEKKGLKNLLILGTKYLMEGPVYPEILKKEKIDFKIPNEANRNRINEIIFNELVYGIIKPESKQFFINLIDNFKKNDCDGVVLGCTEIPLIVLPDDSPLPVLDSTRILARAALREAI